MFFERPDTADANDPAGLTLEELIAIQPRHVRGRLGAGRRGPDGERPGRGRSTTLDFDGLSPYAPGDDVRAIDWRATMRSGQTTMRRFAAASHRAHMLMVDLRPDLYFGTRGPIMAKTACLVAAWLAWKAERLHEPVGLALGDETTAPRRGRRHVLRLLDRLGQAFHAADGPPLTPQNCEAAAARVGTGDELCVISELPSSVEVFQSVGRALSRSRLLRFVVVEDPFVTRPPAPGRYPLRGPDGLRRVIRVAGERAADPHAEARLKDAGWIVDHARNLLPRQDPA